VWHKQYFAQESSIEAAIERLGSVSDDRSADTDDGDPIQINRIGYPDNRDRAIQINQIGYPDKPNRPIQITRSKVVSEVCSEGVI
jgi:hypothetical protein